MRSVFTLLLLSGIFVASVAAAEQSSVYTAGGVSYEIKSPWKEMPVTSAMRQAQFQIPRAEGDNEDGEMGVFHFGAGQGGDVEANVQRWAGQFRKDGGSAEPVVEKREVNGLRVTVVSLEGTYMSGMPMGPQTPKTNFALLGAIAEGSQGPVFFKLTGPKKTVDEARDEFNDFVASLRA
jgi:hypothetical protein